MDPRKGKAALPAHSVRLTYHSSPLRHYRSYYYCIHNTIRNARYVRNAHTTHI